MFRKIRGTILEVPIIRTIIFWGLYWGPLILGNYHLGLDNGKENANYCSILGLYSENGNYYLGFRVSGSGFRV